jgi:hypothetical protein
MAAWIFHSATDAFVRYRKLWDEIGQRTGRHILMDSAFVELLIKHFAAPRVLLGVSNGATHPAMALVEQAKQGFWQTFQPSQAPVGLISFSDSADAPAQIRSLIRSIPGYPLGFAILHQDPDFTLFGNLARSPNVERLEYIQTSRLRLTGTFEGYWKTRSHNLVHNLSRQRRRVAEQGGRLELVVDRKPERAADGIRIYGELESAGWKGQEDSAISAENLQGRFYRELLEHFCGRGEGAIYRLDFNGKPIASSLCLERDGMLVVLKITYDEKIERLSPGLLLHEAMLKSLFSEGRVKVVEYFGRYSDWHRKWTTETRVMYHLNVYRHAWVRAAKRYIAPLLGRAGVAAATSV